MTDHEFLVMDSETQFMEKYPNGLSLEHLIPFYEAIENGQMLKLDWIFPGRVDPKAQLTIPVTKSGEIIEKKPPDPTTTVKLKEFDFDESFNQPEVSTGGLSQNESIGLKHINTSRPRQPRVANMDKILTAFFKGRKDQNIGSSNQASVKAGNITRSNPSESSSQGDSKEVLYDSNTISSLPSNNDQEPLSTALSKTEITCSDSTNSTNDNNNVNYKPLEDPNTEGGF